MPNGNCGKELIMEIWFLYVIFSSPNYTSERYRTPMPSYSHCLTALEQGTYAVVSADDELGMAVFCAGEHVDNKYSGQKWLEIE
jgi:hypothetical protein